MERNSLNKESVKDSSIKASALLCPQCCIEYVEVEFDFEFKGIILHNVKALICPVCEEEKFSPKQFETISRQISDSAER